MKKKLLIAIIVMLAAGTIVYADDGITVTSTADISTSTATSNSNSTSAASSNSVSGSTIKQRLEAIGQKRDDLRTKLQAQNEFSKQKIENALTPSVSNSNKSDLKANQDSAEAVRITFKIKNIGRQYAQLTKRFTNIQNRLENRIKKFKAKGIKTEVAEKLLTDSRAKVAAAETIVDSLKSILVSETNANTITNADLQVILAHKEEIKEAGIDLHQAQKDLVDSLRALKEAAHITTPSSTTTSTSVSNTNSVTSSVN